MEGTDFLVIIFVIVAIGLLVELIIVRTQVGRNFTKYMDMVNSPLWVPSVISAVLIAILTIVSLISIVS